MTRAPGAPIGADEADRILGPLAQYQVLILAVSGGPDSLALMRLTAEWHARTRARSHLVVATVDHGLRNESAAEAAFVACEARALGLEHHTLAWGGQKPASGIPAAARAARYSLLEILSVQLCPQGCAAVVTAHTQDDQAETMLMRLMRGSGVEGLSAMAPVRPMREGSHVYLVRPLLDVPKSRLVASLEQRCATWVYDPSNADACFERPRLRALLPDLAAKGLAPDALARSAVRLRAAFETVLYAEPTFTQTLMLTSHDEIFASFDRAAFAAGPALLRQRLLARLAARFGGTTPRPELSEIEELDLRLAQSQMMGATLGGASWTRSGTSIRVWREVGRVSNTPLRLQDGSLQLWDNRFWVSAREVASPGTICVCPLGAEGLAELPAGLRPKGVPARALWALPGFYREGQLISVPSLAYQPHGDGACAARPSWVDGAAPGHVEG